MAIPLFSRDARRTDSYAEATIQIFGYQITKEVDWAVGDADKFLVVIKQSTEACSGDRSEILNLQTKIFLAIKNFLRAVADETNRPLAKIFLQEGGKGKRLKVKGFFLTPLPFPPYPFPHFCKKSNNLVSFLAVKLQPALNEVFHVRS